MADSEMRIERVALTMGEPAGVGPELLVKAAQQPFSAQLIALADKEILADTARHLGLPLVLKDIDWKSPVKTHQPGCLWVDHISAEEPIVCGVLSKASARLCYRILNRASELALENKVKAVVTAPVHKANINQIASGFLGHTEFFAELANVSKVVMMLATNELRVTLASTHIPLAKVSETITKESLIDTIEIILNDFKRMGISQLKVAVCGLNPHAGEGGLLGKEEQQTIEPVVQFFQKRGSAVSGPFPADTLFTPEKRAQYDVFLAMYHDQGLPVIKAFGFGQCANVTLGLPYIRTSVDHGTALDIAGKNIASSESLEYAVNYALSLLSAKLPQ
ncbi:4-hydroxythreonine-4-phosphate dehydrogenase PdxA [Aliikangiella sp. G2MR2-5]|uniref:4-hydroxythreonine-4-phosphate dehydrogenase PdxA n=1 Tax=Aliikangiella sp. G2MR2-5 TaxID=2788943 RepID=UPI0018AA6551|nr:4-hydroxythreonine-4-phosphate dehydrogenase PdxA [Aliikangiella sp. G2MR2-5]